MKVVAALGVLVLLLLAPPAISQVLDDKLIVPGQRIGRWTLDMKIDDLLRVNGARNAFGGIPPLSQLQSPDAPPDLWVHRWLNVRFAALTIGRDSGEVVALVISSEGYKTDKGLGPGTSREAIESAYGAPTAVTRPQPEWWTGIYDGLGVAFVVGRGNLTENVTVFRSGSARWIFRY